MTHTAVHNYFDQVTRHIVVGHHLEPSVATNRRRERSSSLLVSFRKRWRIFASAAFVSVAFMPKDLIFYPKKLNRFILRRFLRGWNKST